ncbi:MAG: ferredoxin [Candidatus Bilamarchaeaceae archaeon]
MAIKVIHDRNACIGCGACASVCPKFWKMGDDGKSDLVGAKNDVLEVPSEECNTDAAHSCPVNCIHIEKDGKRLI